MTITIDLVAKCQRQNGAPPEKVGALQNDGSSKSDDADASDEHDRQVHQPTYGAHVSMPVAGIQTNDEASLREDGGDGGD